MQYLDASVLVAAITVEPASDIVRQWIRAQTDDLAFSSWTETEVSSALSIKLRRGDITALEKSTALRQFQGMRNTFLVRTPIEEKHFFAARRFAGRHQTGLRAGDALHVAIAADFDSTLVTLDKTMAAGAAILGLPVALLTTARLH